MRIISQGFALTLLLAISAACGDRIPPCRTGFVCSVVFETPDACGWNEGTRLRFGPEGRDPDYGSWVIDGRDRCVYLIGFMADPGPDYVLPELGSWCHGALLEDPGVCGRTP